MEKESVPIDQMTYEQARDQLAQTVEQLESGGTTLDESVTLFKQGEALAKRCHELLEGVRSELMPDSATADSANV